MPRFAVIDIETTGFSPAHHHRIVEVGVVLLDDRGRPVEEWDTMLNPERDIAATEVHGLTAADVCRAPTFAQVAAKLRSFLAGRVPVAHNLSFDAPFVAAEYERLGLAAPLSRATGLCTMQLAPRYLRTQGRNLEACCDCIGVRVESAHSALEDARATARLLAHYIDRDPDFLGTWAGDIAFAQSRVWPNIPETDTPRVPRAAAGAEAPKHFLARLASRMPYTGRHPDSESYLAILDRALLDRHISRHEEDELVAVARMLELTREQAQALHRSYLSALGRLALEDGIVTKEERSDLEAVAGLLGLSKGDVAASLVPGEDVPDLPHAVGAFTLQGGHKVVFTGDAPDMDREELKAEAKARGLRVTSAVSGKTNLLVTADPDSLSGKARRARELGIPIVDYPTYRKMLAAL